MSAAAQARGRGLHVDASARAQAHANLAVDRLEERRDFDALLTAQRVDDVLGVLSVGAGFARASRRRRTNSSSGRRARTSSRR